MRMVIVTKPGAPAAPAKSRLSAAAKAAAFVWMVHVAAYGEPGRVHLLATQDPVLRQALEYDLALQPDEAGDQARAEQYYLRFIEENPDSELIPYIYRRLGYNHGCWVTVEREKAGNVIARSKQLLYFSKVIEHYPKNHDGKFLLGDTLLSAMVNRAALEPTRQRRVERYMEYYEFLKTLDRDTVADRFWISGIEIEKARQEMQESYDRVKDVLSADMLEKMAEHFDLGADLDGKLSHLADMMVYNLSVKRSVASKNMVSQAAGAPYPANVALLEKIAQAFPEDPCSVLALERLQQISQRGIDSITKDMGDELALEIDDLNEDDDRVPHPKAPPIAAASASPSASTLEHEPSPLPLAGILLASATVMVLLALVWRVQRRKRRT